MITLYPHQQEFVAKLRGALRVHQSVLGVAVTGFGKTVVAAYMAQSAVGKGNRVTFTVPRIDLITQTSRTFDDFGIRHSFIAAGLPYDPSVPVQIASIDTLRNRPNAGDCELLFYDEAHLCMSATGVAILNRFLAAGTKIVGATGSPRRLDNKGFDSHYTAIVEGPSPKWLIDNGYLSQYRAWSLPTPDFSKLHTRMGDYVAAEIEEAMDTNAVTGDAVTHWMRHAQGLRTIAFCVSVKHSENVAAKFRDSGIPAKSMDGSMSRDERRKIIAEFANGEIKVLTNCDLLTTGFDMSAQVGRDVPIEAAILLRPTQSLALHLQQIGRVLRKKPQPAIILDHAGNLMRDNLGLPDAPRDWSLFGGEGKVGRGGVAGSAVKQCPKCYAAHSPALKCPECGHVYAVQERELKVVDADLEEMDLDVARKKRLVENHASESLAELVILGKQRGYKNAVRWAAHYHRARRGTKATLGELINYAVTIGHADPQRYAAAILSSIMR